MSDFFGEHDPRKMPRHLFWDCLHLEYDSAVKADISKQNFSVCPRYWYIDATFRCDRCGNTFCFTADEQRAWYEGYGFWIDSIAKRCQACRRAFRNRIALRQEYDRDIASALRSDDCEAKERIATIIDQLYEVEENLPDKIHENRKLLAKQIARQRGEQW